MHGPTENSRPPEQTNTPLGDAKQLFQTSTSLLLIAVHIVAVFWAMLAKKPGTVGTRTYWFDVLFGNTLLLALSHQWWHPDRFLFQTAIAFNTGMWLVHILMTSKQPEHIHSYCIGESRFGAGDNGKMMEFAVGATTGICIVLAGCEHFGLFFLTSAVCNMIRVALVDERDRQRSVQMADAIAEQHYAMLQYEKFQRDRTQR